MKFSKDVSLIIADYAPVWTVVPWVREIEQSIKISGNWHLLTTREDIKNSWLMDNPLAGDELPDLEVYAWKLRFCKIPDQVIHKLMHTHEIPNHILKLLCNNQDSAIIPILEKHISEIREIHSCEGDFDIFHNPSMVEFIKKHELLKLSSSYGILKNQNPEARGLAIERFGPDINKWDGLYLPILFTNPAQWAVDLIKNREFCDHDLLYICMNSNPWAINYIKNKIEKFQQGHWSSLSTNPGAIEILKTHPDKITESVWGNPAIFELTQIDPQAILDLHW